LARSIRIRLRRRHGRWVVLKKNGEEVEEGLECLRGVGTWLIWIMEVEGIDEVRGMTKFVGQEP
jgi:hypothetical protein